jgi:hypothetical protein
MSSTTAARRVAFALLLLFATGCGGGGGNDNPSFEPAGPITITVFGQGKAIMTSPDNRLQIPHGTSARIHVSEDIYTGTYTTTTVTNPPSSPCITIDPITSDYVFTISASAAATCVYPQTADILFTENFGHTTTLYVEGT